MNFRATRYTRDLGQPAIIRKCQNGWQINLRCGRVADRCGSLRAHTRVCGRLRGRLRAGRSATEIIEISRIQSDDYSSRYVSRRHT